MALCAFFPQTNGVKKALAIIQAVIGAFLMAVFVAPMLRPRYWQQGVIAFALFVVGALLAYLAIRRLVKK